MYCKKVDNWGSCEEDCIETPSTCNYECNKTCKIDEFICWSLSFLNIKLEIRLRFS